MRDGMAETVAEAEAQELTLPAQFTRDWEEFAGMIDGYRIGHEMGFEVNEWAIEQRRRHFQGDRVEPWDLSVLELRLMLFSAQRLKRAEDPYNRESYHALADSLLEALCKKFNKPYVAGQYPRDR